MNNLFCYSYDPFAIIHTIILVEVLYSTLVILDQLSKKVPPFTTITTDVELDEHEDDWKTGETRILCLTSATTPDWTHLYSLEFVSEDTGSVSTLEIEPNFLFQYSIPEKQFVVYNRKDKSKRLVFTTTSPAGLVDLVEVLNRSVALLNENKQRKLSSDNGAVLITPPVQNASSMMDSAPASPGGAAGTSTENAGHGQGREPMTAARMIEIIKKFFHRKEERKVKRTTGKFKKLDISTLEIGFPTDFRHVQHMGPGDPRASGTGSLLVSNGLNGHNLLQVPTTPHASTSGADGGGDSSSPPNPASPTNDKRTLSFIFDVIEECNAPPPHRAALNAGNRQTVQFPLLPQANSDTGFLFGGQADITKSQSGGNPERINLIEELKLYMEDEETKKLILEFVKTYEPDKSDSDLEPEKQSSTQATIGTKSNKRWTSGRNSAPPPPKSPAESVSEPAAASLLSRINDTEQGQGVVDERPFNYSAVRESLRFELQQNLDSKPGCQEKGGTALLSRSNTWSNNQAKGPVGAFNTLPSPKPPTKPTAVKKTHSEVRRRPTTPPPPPKQAKEVHVEKAEDGEPGSDNVIGGGIRFSPEPAPPLPDVPPPDESVTITAKKPPPPIPKPRASKMSQMRRANSNPADPHENEPRYANIKPTKSFDSDNEVGVVATSGGADIGHDGALILPRAAQPVPSAANALLVAELRERIQH